MPGLRRARKVSGWGGFSGEPEAVDHPRIRYFHGYLEASKIALQMRLISPSGHRRVGGDSWRTLVTWLGRSLKGALQLCPPEDVKASNLASLCRLHAADPQRYSHYPCISVTGDLLWPDGSPVPESLGLRADDQTTRLRKCGSSKAMMLINQGNRCAKLLAELEEFRRWEQDFDKGSLQLLQPLYRLLDRKMVVNTQAVAILHDSISRSMPSLSQVRMQIDSMVAALKEEQAAEVKKKDYCIEELQKNRPLASARNPCGFFVEAVRDEVVEGLLSTIRNEKATNSQPQQRWASTTQSMMAMWPGSCESEKQDLKQKVKALDMQTADVPGQNIR